MANRWLESCWPWVATAMVKADWIRPGAIVIDVGISPLPSWEDANFAEVESIAGAITLVPGGVGPMTTACLMPNTLAAARHYVATNAMPPIATPA